MINTRNLNFKNLIFYPDLEIESGKLTFVIGKSGVGKSALIKIFNASHNVDDNSVFIDGKDINLIDPVELRKDVLLCGQNVFLFPGSIFENFEMFYKLREEVLPSKEEIQSFLDLTCVPFDMEESVNLMSGGERQRVYLAIFISLARKMVMLDEPTSALDASTSDKFLENLAQHCKEKGLTALIISHDESLARKYSDIVIDLNNVSRGNQNV